VTGDGKRDIIVIGQTDDPTVAPPVFVYTDVGAPALAPGWPRFLDPGDLALYSPASVAELDGVAGRENVRSRQKQVDPGPARGSPDWTTRGWLYRSTTANRPAQVEAGESPNRCSPISMATACWRSSSAATC